jgi:hypothetical protein
MRVIFSFIVYLLSTNELHDVNLYKTSIIKWYKDIAIKYNFMDMKLLYYGNNIFVGSYHIQDDSSIKLDLQIFVDPDEDGSHPYKEDVYIKGKLLTINGNSTDNY